MALGINLQIRQKQPYHPPALGSLDRSGECVSVKLRTGDDNKLGYMCHTLAAGIRDSHKFYEIFAVELLCNIAVPSRFKNPAYRFVVFINDEAVGQCNYNRNIYIIYYTRLLFVII